MQDITIANRSSSGTTWCPPASSLFGGRIVFLTGIIDNELACSVIQQLMALEAQGRGRITLFIDSPGGSVSAALAIVDCMMGITSQIDTFATGTAASMAAVILACGSRGRRSCSPNADILIHQPLAGGISGQVTDTAVAAETLVKKKEAITDVLAKATSNTHEDIVFATGRDTRLSAQDAIDLGIIDRVQYRWTQPERTTF